MIDLNQKYQTRDGQQVYAVRFRNDSDTQYPIEADLPGGLSPIYTAAGRYWNDGSEDGFDLIEATSPARTHNDSSNFSVTLTVDENGKLSITHPAPVGLTILLIEQALQQLRAL